MRMLLLEDDDRVARGMGRLCKLLGHEMVAVRSVGAAMAAIDAPNHGFDVILADLGLPNGESGLDLMRWIADTHPTLRRVLTSGAWHPPEFVVNPPLQQFIGKPFGMSELAKIFDGT